MILEALEPIYGGYSLARKDGVVFIDGAIPGEVVETEIVQKRKDYKVAVVKKVLQASEDRVVPECDVYRVCGGCHYQHICYERQIRMKEDVLRNTLRRLGRCDVQLDGSLPSEPYHYRLRAQLKVSTEGKIGFYRAMSHEVVEFTKCALLDGRLNDVVVALREVGLPAELREVHLSVGDAVVGYIKTRGPVDGEDLFRRFQEAGVSGIYIEGQGQFGLERFCLPLEDVFYFLSAGTFFQSNWALNRRMVAIVSDLIKNLSPDRVLDLYAGAGNFSIPVSSYIREVLAVETAERAVLDGVYTCQFNGIENVRFITKPVEAVTEVRKVPFIIVDPPRTGLTKKALQRILSLEPKWMVYVSCNPSTLARDLGHLTDRYEIESIRLIDMFAQTYHIESLCLLRLKDM
jgi:23S rRNA (uracil1939-C5)-methyltransferase